MANSSINGKWLLLTVNGSINGKWLLLLTTNSFIDGR